MAYEESSLPERSPHVRPVRVADLLSREGHPLRARALAESVRRPDPRDSEPAPRRTFGMAAGAMLVLGTVVAGAFGLNQGPGGSQTAGAGEPVGALPGHGAVPAAPLAPAPAQAPEAAAPVQKPFVNTAATQDAKQDPAGRAGEIGVPAKVRPPAQAPAPKPPQNNPPAQQNQPAPAPQQQSGPVQSLTEPVTETVGGGTLSNVVAPVTSTVDNTLQPALSLIGGLLGHH